MDKYILQEYNGDYDLKTKKFNTFYELQDYMLEHTKNMTIDDQELYFYYSKIIEPNKD